MAKYKIHEITSFILTRKQLMRKTEKYLNDLAKEGIYDVISVSFSRNSALVTMKKLE